MKGNKNIILYLNNLLNNEFVAVKQYFFHSKIFKNLGLDRLNNVEYRECMDELNHADLYADRILFLEGMPILKKIEEVNFNKNVEDIFHMDLELEYNSINDLKEYISYAESVHDYISKDIMLSVLKDEEKHIDFLEKELKLMGDMGVCNYIQSQLKK